MWLLLHAEVALESCYSLQRHQVRYVVNNISQGRIKCLFYHESFNKLIKIIPEQMTVETECVDKGKYFFE